MNLPSKKVTRLFKKASASVALLYGNNFSSPCGRVRYIQSESKENRIEVQIGARWLKDVLYIQILEGKAFLSMPHRGIFNPMSDKDIGVAVNLLSVSVNSLM